MFYVDNDDPGSIVLSVIRFQAQIQKVQTLADGGLRLTLDLSEHEIETATKMMQCKVSGALLEVAAVPVKQERNRDNAEVSTRSEWQSEG